MNKKTSRRGFVLAIVVSLLAALAAYYWFTRPAKPVSYREVKVARGDIALTVVATGTVLPENRLEIKPPIAGRVEQVLVQEGQRVTKGQTLAWMSSTERAALLDAARSAGAAELKRWEELYRPTPVIAPIAGTIILRNIESGQTFTNTDSIFVMADRLTVKAQVDETDIAQIRLRQPAQIVLDAYSQEAIPGVVGQIAFEAKAVNNVTTYEVEVLPQTVPAFMRSGMTANVTFTVAARSGVLWVPTEAIKTQDSAISVSVRDTPAAPPRERPIQIGISDGKRTEVIAGLAEGDTVLVARLPARADKARATNPLNPNRRPPARPAN